VGAIIVVTTGYSQAVTVRDCAVGSCRTAGVESPGLRNHKIAFLFSFFLTPGKAFEAAFHLRNSFEIPLIEDLPSILANNSPFLYAEQSSLEALTCRVPGNRFETRVLVKPNCL
jgi:hypothetical protein